MRTYRFTQLDVFTDTPFTGNPLAVFWDAEGMSDDEMQLVAREMNLSETTFVLPTRAKGATYRVRIFTPEQELAYAGHPSVGTGYFLAGQGRFPLASPTTRVFQDVKAGVLPIDIDSDPTGKILAAWTTQGTPVFQPPVADKARLAEALGLGVADLHPTLPPQIVSTGLAWLMVPLRDSDALDRVTPDPRAFKGKGGFHENVYPFALTPGAAHGATDSRGFPMKEFEDPVTGSASGCLGVYLARHRALPAKNGAIEFVNAQGRHLHRPGLVRVQVKLDPKGEPVTVRVGGMAVETLRGEVILGQEHP